MLAEMAMKKHMEESKKVDIEEVFRSPDDPEDHQDHRGERIFQAARMLSDKTGEYEAMSRPESGIASQSGDESDSDEDREDGRIFFRFDEYHEMQQFQMQQQALEEDATREETV